MPATPACGRCGRIVAYACGYARGLAGPVNDVGVGCSGECAEASRTRRLRRRGHHPSPPPYHTTAGKSGPCVWMDRPRRGTIRGEPIPCRCRVHVDAEPIWRARRAAPRGRLRHGLANVITRCPLRGAMAGTFVCKTCGRSFAPYSRGRHVYCKRCRDKADRSLGRSAGRAIHAQCKECGKAFTAASRVQLFCSGECRLEGKRRRAREYKRREMADPRKRAMAAARTRASIARRRDGAAGGGGERPRPRPAGSGAGRTSNGARPRSITCTLCGRSFARSGRGCHAHCNQCRAEADRLVAKVRSAKCKVCGRVFAVASRLARYCSDECRAEVVRRANRKMYSRRMADPEERAKAAARIRALMAAKKAMEK